MKTCDTGTTENPCKGCPDCMGIPADRNCTELAYFTGEQCVLHVGHGGQHK